MKKTLKFILIVSILSTSTYLLVGEDSDYTRAPSGDAPLYKGEYLRGRIAEVGMSTFSDGRIYVVAGRKQMVKVGDYALIYSGEDVA